VRKTLSIVIIAAAAAAGGAVLGVMATPLAGQAPAGYRAPRTADGKPDLNGIWQALNEANYDIEMHMARPAMALRPGPYGPVPAAPVLALGAVGSVPPGTWITVRLNEPLSSDRNQPGDTFMATLAQPLVANGYVIARRGQSIVGRVAEAMKANRGGGTSRLGLELIE